MRVVLQPTELKVLVRGINSLAKLGHEIYFECGTDDLKIKTVNSSRSAFAVIHFKQIFFDKFASSLPNGSVQRFKVPSSSCTNVFRLTSALEKSVLKCKMFLSTEETILTVQYFCKFGIVKTYNMSIIDCEQLEAVYSLECSPNHLLISARLLGEVVNNFRQSSEELMFILNDGECTFQNHTFQTDPSMITTQIPLNATEFEVYIVKSKCEITFCQKELRVILPFCELISPMIRIYCDRPGKPIIFACTHETRLSARYVLATFPSDGCSLPSSQQSESSRHSLLNRTPVPLQRPPSLFADENIQNDDTVLVNTKRNPNSLSSSRCLLSQANEFPTQIIQADVNMTLTNKQPTSEKMKHSFPSSHHSRDSQSETPLKKVRSALFSNFQGKDSFSTFGGGGVGDNTNTTVLGRTNLLEQRAMTTTSNTTIGKTGTSILASKTTILNSTLMDQTSTVGGHTVLVADSDDED
ncbi:unnamed protein product [Trichobilharzia szidati]|nr:unnamed protein product [Trichobilharzia szidati]